MRGNSMRMRVATNRAGILLAIMRPGQLKNMKNSFKTFLKISGCRPLDQGLLSWGKEECLCQGFKVELDIQNFLTKTVDTIQQILSTILNPFKHLSSMVQW